MATAQQVADAANAAVNSYQSLAGLISAQLAEVTTVVSDFADQLKNGNNPDPATLDTVVQQLTNLKQTTDQQAVDVQASITQLQSEDPGPVTPPPATSSPVSPANPGDQPQSVAGNPVGTGEPNTPVLK